jgi:hypothetical protein
MSLATIIENKVQNNNCNFAKEIAMSVKHLKTLDNEFKSIIKF